MLPIYAEAKEFRQNFRIPPGVAVHRAIGGAGTGKTSLILDRLSEAREDMGLSTSEIGFATFTRAGRAEIAARASEAWGVTPEALTREGWFRTAHSIAHRCCQVEDGQLICGRDGDEWVGAALGAKVHIKSDARGDRNYVSDGDETIPLAMRAWDLARSRLEPLARVVQGWNDAGEPCLDLPEAASVIRRYELAKVRGGRLDFVDMIARFAGIRFTIDGAESVEPQGEVPESLRILAIDEAQDSSRLVDRVCQRLVAGGRIERVWLCGDPYQSIHSFAGGDYEHFLRWNAEEYIMPQSYRCREKVLSLGERCLRRMKRGYRDRGILPAAEGGSVRKAFSAEDAVSSLSADSSVLILGRCAYAIAEYEECLKSRRLPYQWVDGGASAPQLSGLGSLWALQHGKSCLGRDLANAVSMLLVKSPRGTLMRHGSKAAWSDGRKSHLDIVRPVAEDYELAGIETTLQDLICSGDWVSSLEPRYRDRAGVWLSAAKSHGPELANNPPIRLSTIHSAKGLEAQGVILSSITSPRVERARESRPDSHDEECRIAYVAVTRARDSVTVVDDGCRYRMELPL